MTRSLFFALGLFGPSLAFAQDAGDPQIGPNDRLEIVDNAIRVVGRVQKPEVVIVVRREALDQGFQLVLKEDFLDRVVQAVEEPPF